jgi:hypothetical protein
MTKTSSKKILILVFIAVGVLLVVLGIVTLFQKKNKTKKKIIKPLETIIIQPTKKHSASVIFLHGLGIMPKISKIFVNH